MATPPQSSRSCPTCARRQIPCRVPQVGEGNRIGDRNGRNVQDRVEEEQTEKKPERRRPFGWFLDERQANHRQTADEEAEGQEFLCREIAIGKLIAEENGD